MELVAGEMPGPPGPARNRIDRAPEERLLFVASEALRTEEAVALQLQQKNGTGPAAAKVRAHKAAGSRCLELTRRTSAFGAGPALSRVLK